MKTSEKIINSSFKTTILLVVTILTFGCGGDDSPHILYPTITTISPTIGPKNTSVTINGNDFGTTVNNTHVFFNDVEAIVQAVTNTQITAIVPARAYTGLVKVISNGTELIGSEFTYIIDIQVSTLAGSTDGFADGLGGAAKFYSPRGIAIDSQNNIYVADQWNHKIRKITPSGSVSTLTGSTEGFDDGLGSTAKFNHPFGVAIDSLNNIYVADTGNHKIRKITQE